MDNIRINAIQERFDKGVHHKGHENYNPDSAKYDIDILLDEIHQRDILIADFREQREAWKKDVEYYRNLFETERNKNKSPIQKASDAISAISEFEYSQGFGVRYEAEQYFKKLLEEIENGKSK